jgi:hypothetical protein
MGDFIRKSDLIFLRIKQLNNNLKVSSIKLFHNGQKNHQNMNPKPTCLVLLERKITLKKTKNLNRFQQYFFYKNIGLIS